MSYEIERLRSDDEWKERAKASEEGANQIIFLAFDGSEPVGMVGAFEVDGDTAQLVSMWVSESVRRQGVGRSLTSAVLDWATATGKRRVTVWVADGNDDAIALYRATGFAPTGDRKPLRSDPGRMETCLERPLG
jgi:ribosomal protein S18 acetylase RimI-like enzyme